MSERRGRPLIGVTGPAARLSPGRIAASIAVRRAGGRTRLLFPQTGLIAGELHGLLITGGSDIDPSLYLTSGGPWVAADPSRDEFELAALDLARRRELPVLGICRGAQLMNVAAGGTLHRDITELRRVTSNRPSLLPRKLVDIEEDSRLAGIVKTAVVRANSLHHQAVDTVGSGLQVVARDRDRIVQAIEAQGDRFCIGVQWHPEYLPWHRVHSKLFAALVEAARSC